MPNKFTELTRSKMAAVVQVFVAGYGADEVKSILNPRLGDLRESSGSGFFVRTEFGEGVIVTNAHVVQNAKTIEIVSMLTSEETFQAELVGMVKNQEPDIAIIRLKKDQLSRFKSLAKREIPYLSLRSGFDISRGTELKAIGYPMGMTEPNITGGEITNFMPGDRAQSEKFVTDAAINPGNSGGPAIDDEGKVVGINTSIYQDAENIGFITPSSFIEIILKNIFENNAICFSDIGANFQINSEGVALGLGMNEAIGIVVTSVEKGGFLDQAGIIEEDVILSLNGIRIDRHGIVISDEYFRRRNIFDVFKLIPIGTEIEVVYWRNGAEYSVNTKTISHPERKLDSKPIIAEREFIDVWGMTIQSLSYEILESFNLVDSRIFYQLAEGFDDTKERLVVTHVQKGESGSEQGWGIGEVIAEVNGVEIHGLADLLTKIKAGEEAYKLKSESGMVGFFPAKELKKKIKILNPSMFLK